MGKRSLRAFVVLMLVLGSLLAIGGIAVAQDESLSIYDNLVNAGNFTTLTSAIEEKGLTETYTGDGNEYTFFAPNDAAFQALSVADRIKLYRNPQTLIDTLNHMTVEGVYSSADLTDGTVLTTLDGGTLTITHDGNDILVNGAEITSPDLAASNGVIHVVNTVIPLEGAAPVVEEVAAEGEDVAATEASTETVTAEATEAPAEEATEAPAEEATAVPAEEATAVPAEEATAVPAEEATAVPAEEATAVSAEEATAAPAEEATAVPAEEATAVPAEEATAAPAEEAAATPEPTEEAPEELPATGAEANSLALVAVAVLTIMLLGAFTFVSRRNS